MATSKYFDVSRVRFQKKSAGDVMSLFIKVARSYPKQAGALFDKYVDFLKSTNPEWTDEKSTNIAKSNIETMAGRYGTGVFELLANTYCTNR